MIWSFFIQKVSKVAWCISPPYSIKYGPHSGSRKVKSVLSFSEEHTSLECGSTQRDQIKNAATLHSGRRGGKNLFLQF